MTVAASGWAHRLRHPRTTVRLRLTLLYGALFLACGAGLLAITYTLVDNAGFQHGPTFVGTPGPPNQVNIPPRAQARTTKLPPPLQRILRSRAGRNAVHFVVADQRLADQHQLIIESAIALAIMAIISTGLGWLVAGRVLRPLRVMTTATRDISAANLHERLDMPGPRDELRQLADTIDGLLGRLEGTFIAQRRFVMNASHELRTPLTAARALLEMVLEDPAATVETYRETCQQVLDENRQQEELIDALLTLAQGQRGIGHAETMDLATIVREVLDAQQRKIAERELQVELTLTAAPLTGDRRLLARLVSNLLENAIVHNARGGRINLQVRVVGGAAELAVANSGPVVPSAEIERLLEPFQRMTAERVGPRTGLGLGLSIVAAIAEAHDATLDVVPGEAGGLSVTVRFPDTPTTSRAPGRDDVGAEPEVTRLTV
jgi:signal transduction histidine kinase